MLNFDKYLASLLPHIPKKMYNNVSKASPTLNMLLRKKKTWDEGGDTIRPHIKYKQSTSGGSYSKYDKLDTTPQDTRTAAEFRMKQSYAGIRFNGYEEAADKGELAVHKLVAQSMDDAEEKIKHDFANFVFGDGTGNNGKDFTGLLAYVDDGTNIANYGGIDRATNPFWKAHTGEFKADYSDLVEVMKRAFATTARGGMTKKVDFIVTDLDTWLAYEAAVSKNASINQPLGKVGEKFANLGFVAISFFGVPVVYDEYAPEGTMFFVNSETYQFWGKPGRIFQPGEIVKVHDEDSKAGQIFTAGELVGTEPRANAVLRKATV